MGVTASLSGASFGAGFIGTQSAMTAISSSFTTSFLTGAAVGGATGFTSGFVTGSGNAWMGGESFGQGLWSGTKAGFWGGVSGAVIGGVAGGIDALKDSRTFWDGAPFEKTTVFDQNLPSVPQVGDNNCLPTAGEVVDNSFGGSYNQSTLRNRIAPGTDPYNDPLDDLNFWNGFANETGHTLTTPEGFNSRSLGNILKTVNNNGRVAITLDTGNPVSHTVVLKSLTTKTIYRASGTKISFIYRAMSNGRSVRVSANDFINLFYIFK